MYSSLTRRLSARSSPPPTTPGPSMFSSPSPSSPHHTKPRKIDYFYSNISPRVFIFLLMQMFWCCFDCVTFHYQFLVLFSFSFDDRYFFQMFLHFVRAMLDFPPPWKTHPAKVFFKVLFFPWILSTESQNFKVLIFHFLALLHSHFSPKLCVYITLRDFGSKMGDWNPRAFSTTNLHWRLPSVGWRIDLRSQKIHNVFEKQGDVPQLG